MVTHTVATIDHEANGTSKSRPLGRSAYYSQISAATRQVRSTVLTSSKMCPVLSHRCTGHCCAFACAAHRHACRCMAANTLNHHCPLARS